MLLNKSELQLNLIFFNKQTQSFLRLRSPSGKICLNLLALFFLKFSTRRLFIFGYLQEI